MPDLESLTRLRWVEAEDITQSFTSAPYPPRAARGRLGPLVRSLREVGCISPILARPSGNLLQVVCGHRRLLAAQAAGLFALPVLVRELSDEECRRIFSEENAVREPLASPAPLRLEEPAPPAPEAASAAVRPAALPAAAPATAPAPAPAPVVAVPLPAPAAVRAPAPVVPPAAARSTSSPPERPIRPAPAGVALGEEYDLAMSVLARRAQAAFRTIAASREIPVEEVESIGSEIIDMAPVRRGRDLRLFTAAGSCDWLTAHSLIVTGLGVHLAEALGWTGGQVKKFGLACLLHDIGMLFVPTELVLAPRSLDPAQRAEVERHPVLGREIIQASRAWGAQIHLVAQDHHERWDGSGYPGKKKEKEVDLPARIGAFLDCFAALIASRPHRPPLLYSEALRFMTAATELGLHDPAILAHFRNVFSDLPVGSCLRLEDGRLGRVVGADPRNPRRHRVRILGAARGGPEDRPIWIESNGPLPDEVHPPAGRFLAHGQRPAASPPERDSAPALPQSGLS